MTSWKELRARAGRNDLPAILVRAVGSGDLDPADYPKAVHDAWTGPEWPLRIMDADPWTYLFGLAIEPGQYLKEDIPTPVSELPLVVDLYRGSIEEYSHGMSWTTDRDRAEWFATRLESAVGTGHLYFTAAPREAILATFHEGRGENEYVLDFDYLEEVSELEIQRKKNS